MSRKRGLGKQWETVKQGKKKPVSNLPRFSRREKAIGRKKTFE